MEIAAYAAPRGGRRAASGILRVGCRE